MGRLRQRLAALSGIDRRYIYLVMLAAVVLPFLAPIDITARPSEETLRFAEALEKAIESPKPIMVEIDFGTQTMAEMEPIAISVMHELFHHRKKVVFLTLVPEAAALIRRYLARMEERYGLVYGRDYVFLGYASAFTIAIYNMGTSIEGYFHADDRGTPLAEIPIMQGITNLEDLSAVLNIASNTNPHHWINYAVAPYGIDFLMSCTAVQATDYFPYLQTGQVKGLLAGGRAGAEYEGLLVEEGVLDKGGDGVRGLGSQSLALLTIIAFIVVGNMGYFAGRSRGGRS